MRSVFIKTLGCKVNTFDSHALENQFKAKGYQLLDDHEQADITVINTCSVTATAEKEARYLLRRYKRDNPESVRVITGCYAQIDSASLEKMPEVDYIVPNEVKEQLVQLVEKQASEKSGFKDLESKLPEDVKAVTDNKQSHFKSALTLFDSPRSERARAFLKIQDGCNGFCAYCQIPYARGASRSVPSEKVLEEVKNLVGQGTPEIVFTGIHIGDYGEDLDANGSGESRFVELLTEVFKVPGLKRVRISSLEPSEVSVALLDILYQHRDIFCDHFHLPLQSGDDRILKLMGRQYDCDTYRKNIELIRSYFPDAHISADVIPGFPGETSEEFENTINFIKLCDINTLHVFPYSKRPNTRALRMPNHLDVALIKERAAQLRSLSEQLHMNYTRKFLGKKMPVLWESWDSDKQKLVGKTKNYLTIASRLKEHAKPFSISEVTLKGFLERQKVLGEIN